MMDEAKRDEILATLDLMREAVTRSKSGLKQASSHISGWRVGRRPTAVEMAFVRDGLSKGVVAMDQLLWSLNEYERLIRHA